MGINSAPYSPAADDRTSQGEGPTYAWFLVGLLWLVAVLNYLDRQVLFSMFPLLRADLGLDNLQLGLLSTVFLWVYGALSPFGGYLADRFGPRRVILVSLLVWSAVTWATGLAGNFAELIGARALMGISEACYLPAGLALIAAVHGERTRSLATGLHQSGLYIGTVFGGVLGGRLGALYGWRFAFTILGVTGIVYAVILTGLLRPGRTTSADRPATPRFLPTVAEVLASPGFGIIVLAFGITSIANWTLYTWLADYLHQRFGMDLARAGFSATFYLLAPSFVGIVVGGRLADRWSACRADSRSRTQGIGLLLEGVFLFGVGAAAAPVVLLACLVFVGLGKGFYDCNTMPALCQIARPEVRSTGFGVLNLVGCFSGGTAAAVAGALKDHIGIGACLQVTAGMLLFAAYGLWRLRLPPTPEPCGHLISPTLDKETS